MATLTHWMLHKFSGTRTSEHIPRDSALIESIRASSVVSSFPSAAVRLEMPLTRTQGGGSRSVPTSPERDDGNTASTKSRLTNFTKYNLWPRTKKLEINEQPMIFLPHQDRSPSSLSDSSASGTSSLGYQRPTLANRRKISVPELRRKSALDSKEPTCLDSPTIPGRPPLRTVASVAGELNQHWRSSSLPEDESRKSMAVDEISIAISTRLAGALSPPQSIWPLTTGPSYLCNPTRPLSPIFSPPECTTPTSVYSPTSPESRPQVPPKSPSLTMFLPPTAPSRKESLTTIANTPKTPSISTIRSNSSEKTVVNSPSAKGLSPPIKFATFPPPKASITDSTHNSSMDRGRPIKRIASKKSNHISSCISTSPRSRTSTSPHTNSSPSATPEEVPVSYAILPTGLKPMEATLALSTIEQEALRSQACAQAERFEILQHSQVNALSKELRSLDERCDYLRTTYRSLRAGRQKLHNRMLSYLKSDSISFSKDRVLKQMEALAELDKAIDDWAVKSELAENRRLRLRQKLLEHVAGAITLGNSLTGANPAVSKTETGLVTPPRSKDGKHPEDAMREKERKNVESIKIYADTQVLTLFSDIEQAIGRMCEAC